MLCVDWDTAEIALARSLSFARACAPSSGRAWRVLVRVCEVSEVVRPGRAGGRVSE